jgi:hypothetical protein
LSGTFTLADSMYQGVFEPVNASPALADVNGDGRFDLIIGTYSGGVVLYSQQIVSGVANSVRNDNPFFEIYPNPARDAISIRLSVLPAEPLIVEVRDVLGACLAGGRLSRMETVLDTSALPAGFYLCRVIAGGRVFSRTFVKY